MSTIDALAAEVRAGLDADERAARAVGCHRIEAHEFLMGTKWLVLCDEKWETPTETLPAELADHIVRQQPARTLRDVASKRTILDRILAEPHGLVDTDDPYPCPRRGTSAACQCGRDVRVAGYLGLMVQAWQETT